MGRAQGFINHFMGLFSFSTTSQYYLVPCIWPERLGFSFPMLCCILPMTVPKSKANLQEKTANTQGVHPALLGPQPQIGEEASLSSEFQVPVTPAAASMTSVGVGMQELRKGKRKGGGMGQFSPSLSIRGPPPSSNLQEGFSWSFQSVPVPTQCESALRGGAGGAIPEKKKKTNGDLIALHWYLNSSHFPQSTCQYLLFRFLK